MYSPLSDYEIRHCFNLNLQCHIQQPPPGIIHIISKNHYTQIKHLGRKTYQVITEITE